MPARILMVLVGIIGKPNVGKSTFYKSLTLADVLIANYPFATIKPNRGVGHVSIPCVDREFGVQCMPRHGWCDHGTRFIPVEVIDVAGLVPGASEGKGLGNAFLDDLRQADVLIHVIDASGRTDEKGEPTEAYDPLNDIHWLEDELDAWWLGILNRQWERLVKTVHAAQRKPEEELARALSGVGVTREHVKPLLPDTPLHAWTEEEKKHFIRQLRRKAKPMLIAANKADLASDGMIQRLQREAGIPVIPTSAEAELALREATRKGLIHYTPGKNDFTIIDETKLTRAQRDALTYIREKVLKRYGSTGVQEALNTAVFQLAGMIAVYPGGTHKLEDSEGRVLPDVFLLSQGSTALDFARRIHEDLAKGFIRAINVKTKQPVGKDYVLQHRDVIEIIARA